MQRTDLSGAEQKGNLKIPETLPENTAKIAVKTETGLNFAYKPQKEFLCGEYHLKIRAITAHFVQVF